jgi:outer membrane protein assembly factor BamB
MVILLFAGISLAGIGADHEPFEPPAALYPGQFDGPPASHWQRRLPGRVVNSASHAERTRPTVHGGVLLIGAAGGKGLYMLSRRDGGLIRTLPANGSVESEAAIFEDKVYFSDTAGMTWCYTIEGEKVWSHQSGAPILVRPTVADGRVYLTNVDDLAVALDASTGDLVWRYQRQKDFMREAELALYAAPPALVLDELVVLGFSDGSLVTVNRETGDQVWDRRVGEGRYPDLVAAPTAHGQDIYSSGYFRPLVAIDQTSHNIRWRQDIGAANSPVIDDSGAATILFHPGTDGKLRAIVTLTGAEKWTWNSGTTGALTSPVITPAGLLVGSSEGSLYLVDKESGAQLWRYHEEVRLEGIAAPPVVAGRQLLFVTNAGNLYSMLVPKEPTKWPPELEAVAPEPEEVAPEPEEVAPEPEEVAPEPEEVAPEPEEVAPEPEEVAPEPDEVTPDPEEEAPEPKEEAPEPEGESTGSD